MPNEINPRERKRDRRHDPFRGAAGDRESDIRLQPKFETVPDAQSEARKRIRGLEKRRQDNTLSKDERHAIRDLARRLRACHKGGRCWSLACPICYRARRRKFVHQVRDLMDDMSNPHLAFITLLSADWVVPCELLDELEPSAVFNSIRYQLNQSELWGRYVVCGYLDGEFVGGATPEYHIHAHLLIPYKDAADLGRCLKIFRRKFYRQERHGWKFYRPMKVELLDNNKKSIVDFLTTISYVNKSFWSENKNRNRAEGISRIPEPYHSDQLVWVDQFLPSQVRFLFGCKQVGNRFQKTFL